MTPDCCALRTTGADDDEAYWPGLSAANQEMIQKFKLHNKRGARIKARVDFFQGREDDKTISRTSTNTLNIECSYKVKAIFNSKYYCFSLASLLLGLYDYRLKHLAILEEINTTTTPKFYFSYNDDFNNQDDDYGVSTTFNVADLTPYFGLEESESRMTPFQGGRMI